MQRFGELLEAVLVLLVADLLRAPLAFQLLYRIGVGLDRATKERRREHFEWILARGCSLETLELLRRDRDQGLPFVAEATKHARWLLKPCRKLLIEGGDQVDVIFSLIRQQRVFALALPLLLKNGFRCRSRVDQIVKDVLVD